MQDGPLGQHMSDLIYTCDVSFLSLRRAERLAPPEFAAAFSWFMAQEGRHIDKRPYGEDAPPGLPITVASQRGIHYPSYENLPSKGAGKAQYALTVQSKSQRYYSDKDVIDRGDGSWIFDYKAHRTAEGKRSTDKSNERLMRNLEDGVPVGVIVQDKKRGGFTVLGLAYVERYNEKTETFTLHGPVNERTESLGLFYSFMPSDLTGKERKEAEALLLAEDTDSEKALKFDRRVRRERQADFRKALIAAYGGSCAVTQTDVLDTLQAAHIDPYRGTRSQRIVNGILMRADIHLLYAGNLIAIEPETHVLRLSQRIASSAYARYADKPIRVPNERAKRPSDSLLAMHFEQFVRQQAGAA